MIWWHSKFIDEINREATTIKDISDKACKTLKELEKLKVLEEKGKIRVKMTGTLNPMYIEIVDNAIESQVAKNPLVEVAEEHWAGIS